ncbi:MAG: sulfate ABC transporter ATP-binding protein [Deltaproteobacteria bacterium]|nr:sulfate ABC transporter ATP-binding protein [Deltaproteobacteria bacterium]
MSIEAKSITKQFGAFTALGGVDLHVKEGDLLALLGPSGSGKTTLLRILAGLETPDAGRVFIDDVDATDHAVGDRGIGFVFQHYALFKHMSVLENVAFGLRVKPRRQRLADAEIRKRALELLDFVQLAGLSERMPAQLSGGQRQRVALARALAVRPRVLLLDEPFGALDARVRKDLRRWLRKLHDELHITSVFVTHDQEEALELADRVVVMNQGRIEQVGSTDELYERPASPFIFDFLGDANVLPAEVRGRSVFLQGAEQPIASDAIHPSGAADVYVRPGDLRLADAGAAGVEVVIESVQRTGPIVRVAAQLRGGRLPVAIELPHLHHDVPHFVAGAALRLRLMQFSVFPREARAPSPPTLAAPVLIGREREREIAG